MIGNFLKGLLGGNLLPIGIVALVVIGGAFAYHKIVVSTLETNVANLETANVVLTENVNKAVNANTSLQNQITRIQFQSTQLTRMIGELQQQDDDVNTWFEEARQTLLSGDELSRRMAEDPNATLNTINKDIACTIINFGKRGLCKDGAFVAGATK